MNLESLVHEHAALHSLACRCPGRRAAPLIGTAALLACAAPGFAAKAPELPPLTTASGNPRLPGKFVWADLVTDDVPAARKFYAGLFGWTFRDSAIMPSPPTTIGPCAGCSSASGRRMARPSRGGLATFPFPASIGRSRR